MSVDTGNFRTEPLRMAEVGSRPCLLLEAGAEGWSGLYCMLACECAEATAAYMA